MNFDPAGDRAEHAMRDARNSRDRAREAVTDPTASDLMKLAALDVVLAAVQALREYSARLADRTRALAGHER